MRRRIFLAINLPEDIKAQLLNYQKEIKDLPIRWVKEDNLHITLVFLGYIRNEEILEISKITKEVALRHQQFFIELKRICYGPPKVSPPRLIWAEGERSEQLGKLQIDLGNSLSQSSLKDLKKSENRPYLPHITLGRIQRWEWRQIEPEERPKIETEISLTIPVNSIEIMESQLKRGGAEYIILESVPLG